MPIVPERLRQFFAKGRTGHHVLTLASGTLIAQALNVLAAPILTRLYVPADFGRNELFISFLSVASVAVSLRYDAAIVTARTRRTAAYVVLLSTVLIVPVTVAAVATMHVMICQSWFGFGNLPSYSPLLLALALPAAGLFVVFRSSLIR
jgi:O-antigen/teichoic acid export membrane protein